LQVGDAHMSHNTLCLQLAECWQCLVNH
jgi:hypothetical protein